LPCTPKIAFNRDIVNSLFCSVPKMRLT